MIVRCFIAVGVGGVLFIGVGLRAAFGNEAVSSSRDTTSVPLEASAPLIDEVVFVGLRHIAPEAVQAQISSRGGARLSSKRIESDVRALGRLGWFGDISAETQPATDSS